MIDVSHQNLDRERRSKKFIPLLTCFFILIPCLLMAAESSIGAIEEIKGTVYLQHRWESQPSVASINGRIFSKDIIKTGLQSKIKIRLMNEIILDIGGDTDLILKEMLFHSVEGVNKAVLDLRQGKLKTYIDTSTDIQFQIEIFTPVSVITNITKTELIVFATKTDQNEEGKEAVCVVNTIGRSEVKSIYQKTPESLILEPFQKIFAFKNEPLGNAQDFTLKELEEFLKTDMVPIEAIEEAGEKGKPDHKEEKEETKQEHMKSDLAKHVEEKQEDLMQEVNIKKEEETTTLAQGDEFALFPLGPEDVLNIAVWKDENLTKEVLVRPDGKISFPLVGEVQAEGRTTEELRQEIIQKLNYFIPDPVVTITVLKMNLRIYIIGNVASPGEFTLGRRVNVLQALALAGGLTPFASLKDIIIVRKKGTQQIKFHFNYKEVVKGKNLEQNIYLQRDDVIIVP